MTRNKTPDRRPAASTRTRTVYELRPQAGRAVQVEATTAAELAAHLARELHTDPQDSRAAAHMLHVCRANITAPTWSARRVGRLEFVPDEPVPARPNQAAPAELAEQQAGSDDQAQAGSDADHQAAPQE